MDKFEPTGHRVLLKPDIKTKTESGIVLHYDERRAANECDTGIVIAIGPTAWMGFGDGRPWCKVGDRVYFSKYGAKVLKDEDDFYVICNDDDILAIVDVPAQESVND